MDNRKRQLLDGGWELFYQSNAAYQAQSEHPVTYDQICGRGGHIPAVVPGNMEIDLQRAGVIEDPFLGQNVWKMQKWEATHLFYGRKFFYEPTEGATPTLVFEGIDTVAEIFLNGERIGGCDNMMIEHRFPVTQLRAGENDLTVHITPACIAARGRKIQALNNAMKYEWESLRLRKAASMFGWDIMPRLVSGGIWKSVYIEETPPETIEQAYLMTTAADAERKTAELVLFYETKLIGDDLSEYQIAVRGVCGDSTFEARERLWFTAGKLALHLEDAALWWPKGYGEQPLYEVTVELLRGGRVIDCRRFRTGLRTVRLERTALTDSFYSGQFQFYVNDKKIFLLGTNFVPIDALHSRDRERLPQVLSLLEDVGCNAVRCWGGGVYENESFYEFCDRKGILIWQDFMMACGTYPIDEAFAGVIREEAETVIRRLRQHPSLLLWAGDNECDMGAFKKRPSGNRITRQVLAEAVEFEDPVRPFLPSSPFVDKEAEGKPEAYLPENHLWGPRDYYKSSYYTASLCHFASEIGYHGAPARSSIERFIPADKLWPWQGNDDWMAHAAAMEPGGSGNFNYRIKLMADQIREMFGTKPDNLDEFVLTSQISQAEAMKFFIELFRMGQPQRTGIIWWNLIDGWPQFSDAVVDYYYHKKLAYYYIRQVQQPVLLAMREPENWHTALTAVNDTGREISLHGLVRELTSGENVWEDSVRVAPGVHGIKEISYSHGETKLYRIEWEYDGIRGGNHYLAGHPPFSPDWYRRTLLEAYYKEEVEV